MHGSGEEDRDSTWTEEQKKKQTKKNLIHTYVITSSRLNWLSELASISLNTLVDGFESPMAINSTSKINVAPPGMTLPAPRSP